MQDHHRAMVDGKAAEAALELVAIDDRAQSVARDRLVDRQHVEVRRPVPGPAALGVAGAHEEPIRPGVKARRVAELRKVPPDGQQRLLRRVLGEIGVAQDPVRHRVEAVAHGDGEAREGLFVAALRPEHELGIHPLRTMRVDGSSTFEQYGRGSRQDDSHFDERVRSARMSATFRRPLRAARNAVLVAVAMAVTGCGTISRTPPAPTPADFPGIAGVLSQRGVRVDRIVSGDAGCDDVELGRTAIGFDASGLDQATPVRIHVYIFRNRATYDRLRATIDHCAAAFVTDPETFESVETSPYVFAGQGPWATAFKDNLRAAIAEAAGTGD